MSSTSLVEVKSLAIVLIGNFNPAIVQPFWLANKQLIRESEAYGTKVDLIHNELVSFDLPWVKFNVRPNRFEVSSKSEPYFGPLKDLVNGIFTFLKETPVKAIGINHIYNLNLRDAKRFYEFGNKMVPLRKWDFMNDPRVIQLEMLEQQRKDQKPGHYRIKIESSNVSTPFGVNVVLTDHLDIDTRRPGKDSELVSVLNTHWNDSFKVADERINKICESF